MAIFKVQRRELSHLKIYPIYEKVYVNTAARTCNSSNRAFLVCYCNWWNKKKKIKTYLGLSGEGFGLRGGGVRGTAGLGAMVAAGTRP